MNQATATNRSATCDDCGARRVRITRVYKGIRYCPTCYKRMFKRRMCTGCGNFARLPVRIPEAVCRTLRTTQTLRALRQDFGQHRQADALRAGVQALLAVFQGT